MFAVAIFISYGLQAFVPVSIIWDTYIEKRLADSEHKLLWEYVLRVLTVIVTCKFKFLVTSAILTFTKKSGIQGLPSLVSGVVDRYIT